MSPSEVTAWATVGLLVVTGIYAWLTRRMSVHAKSSAESAREAARHSEAATLASQRTAAAAEAALEVDFEVAAVTSTSRTVVQLTSRTSNIYVHQVDLKLMVVPRSDGDIYEVEGTTTSSSGPVFLHAGEQTFGVVDRSIEPGSIVLGSALVTYSLEEAATTRQRLVSIGRAAVVA